MTHLANSTPIKNPVNRISKYLQEELSFHADQPQSPFSFFFSSTLSPEISISLFIQRDPIGYGDDYCLMNLYCYVGCNPVNFADPSGKDLTIGSSAGLHNFVAIDIYDEKGNKIGVRRFDYSVNWGWTTPLAIIPGIRCATGWVRDFKEKSVKDTLGLGEFIIDTYPGTPDDDKWMLEFLLAVQKDPPNYSVFTWNSNYFAGRMVKEYIKHQKEEMMLSQPPKQNPIMASYPATTNTNPWRDKPWQEPKK